MFSLHMQVVIVIKLIIKCDSPSYQFTQTKKSLRKKKNKPYNKSHCA